MSKPPVLFIVFNRPEETKTVLERLKLFKPEKLYVAADGPRDSKPGEKEKVNQVRALFDGMDSDCSLTLNFREKNLGCKKAVSSAIDWFFQNEPEGIILEDDCLPDLSFFSYCTELLAYYRNNEKISMISGDNFSFGKLSVKDSYYYSMYSHVWGWASWRRAWADYDVSLKSLDENLEKLKKYLKTEREFEFWKTNLSLVRDGKIDTWDYQWVYTNFIKERVSVMPASNLITNIGFAPGATHTLDDSSIYSNMKSSEMKFPLKHPGKISANAEGDKYSRYMFLPPEPKVSVLRRIKNKLKGFLHG